MRAELTKEEFIRFELTKAFIAAKPELGAHTIGQNAASLTRVILDPDKADAGQGDSTAKS